MQRELDKTYNPQESEDGIYKKWEELGFFNPDILNKKDDLESYSIVMPPPNVTGTLHLGHAAMLALEDIMIRYQRMQGKKTLWVPGTDHAAIATQTKVEKLIKEEGLTRHQLGRGKFLERVDQFAQNSHDTIVNQIKKMGSSCDWTREAFTLDETRTKAVRSVFKLMYDDGLIYRGDRVVNWCPRCHSTLADDEVEYKEQKAKLYTFKYSKDFPITIATTRPETKLGDTAVAVNPKDERYKEFIGKEYKIDFCGIPLKIKVIADWHIDMEFGTGALGVTPAHSMVDWQMAEEHVLESIKVIDEDGNIKEGFGEFSGLTAKEARKKVVDSLNGNGLIEKEEEIDNKLSICYRCDTAIEPLPSLQWFIDMNKPLKKFDGKTIKEVSIEAVRSGIFGREKINIYPERFEKNYFHWMENLSDWCISRQIWYGHQIPVWYKKTVNTEQLAVNNNNQDNIYVGVEAPEGEGWVQDEDTLDTWFSSGLWTFSTLANSPDEIRIEDGKIVVDSEDFRNFHPTNVMETGYDILFFWVARMIIMTAFAIEDIPFKDIYLHGLVLDDKGKKMSKSKGNVIDPLEMNKKYGTDATRLALVIGSTPGNDMRLSEEKIESNRNFVNKLWNISRYIDGNLQTENKNISKNNINSDKLTLSDSWIIGKLNETMEFVNQDISVYSFSQAADKLQSFTKDDLADWYLEASKFDKGEETENVLGYVLKNVLKLWHPFIPFVTERIWTGILSSDSIMIQNYPGASDCIVGEDSLLKSGKFMWGDFETIKEIIGAIRNARAENKVEPAKKIKAVIYTGEHKELIESQSVLIKSLRTGVGEIELIEKDAVQVDAINIAVGDIKIYLLGAIDKEKEAERIKKEIENLEKVIAGIRGKLSNKEFVERAPEAVVNKEKERLVKLEEELKNLG